MAKPPLVRAAAASVAGPAAVIFTLVSCALFSCELFSPAARVLVVMPEPPPHWQRAFPGLGFTLEYRDASGRVQEVVGEDWSAGVEIACSKEQNSPILAYPWTDADSLAGARVVLPPAGGFFPLSLGVAGGQQVLSLSWEDGCAALVVSRVRALGRDVGLFNVPRLVERLRLADDPWTWDAVAMAERIAAGDFTVFDIDALPCRDVDLAVGEGQWFLESPCTTVRGADSAGMGVLPAVPLGPHTLFSLEGARIGIYVGEKETIVGPMGAYGNRIILAFVSTVAPSGPMSASFSHLTPP
jgi:hypothetical protein